MNRGSVFAFVSFCVALQLKIGEGRSCRYEVMQSKHLRSRFQMLQLKSYRSCADVKYEDCLYTHEANTLCPCICKKKLRHEEVDDYGISEEKPVESVEVVEEEEPEAEYYEYETEPVEEVQEVEYIEEPEPPMAPVEPEPARGLHCFHADDMVMTKEGPKTLSNLYQNSSKTQVLGWNQADNTLSFSPIIYWLHASPDVSMDFLVIKTTSGRQISISDYHLIYRSISCRETDSETIFAIKLTKNQCIWTASRQIFEKPTLEKIISIRREHKKGVYAPITESGSILVNDVIASCYVNNENEVLQRLVYSVALRVRDWLTRFAPISLVDALFGSSQGRIPEVMLAVDQLQKHLVHEL